MSSVINRLWCAAAAILTLIAAIAAAPAPIPEEKAPRSPAEIQTAQDDLRSLLHLAERSAANEDELWQAWQRFQSKHAGTPQWREAARAMSRVQSPLDNLDRRSLPADLRPSWLPLAVAASGGDLRGRVPGQAGGVDVSADGRLATFFSGKRLGAGPTTRWAYSARLWDLDSLQERAVVPDGLIIAIFENGKRLITMDSENRRDLVLRVWDISADKPKERATFGRKQASFEGAYLASNQRTLLVYEWDKDNPLERQDQVVRRWDIASDPPKEMTPLERSNRSFEACSIARASMTLIDVDRQAPTAVHVWDLNQEPPQIRCQVPIRPEFGAGPMALSPDGKLLAMRHIKRPAVVLWDVSGAEPKGLDTLEEVDFQALVFSADGRMLAVMGHDAVVRLWPVMAAARKDLGLKEGENLATFALRYVPVSMAFAEDGKTIVMIGDDNALHVWDLQKHADRFPAPRGHRGAVRALAFAPDGKTLATAGGDSTIRLWDLTGRRAEETAKLEEAGKAIVSLEFTLDGRTLVSLGGTNTDGGALSDDNAVRFWDVSDRKAPQALAAWRVPSGPVYCVALHPIEPWLVVGGVVRSDDKNIDPKTGHPVVRGDGSGGGYVCLWDRSSLPPTERAAFHCTDSSFRENPYSFARQGMSLPAFDPRGRTFVCRTGEGVVRVIACSADSIKELCQFQPYSRGVNALALSPDGRTLATSGWNTQDDHGLRLWDWDGKGVKPLSEFQAEKSELVGGLVFSPDGKQLAGLTEKGFAVFDAASGKVVYQCEDCGRPNQVAFAPDGRHLATANLNGTAYIFRLPASLANEQP